MVWKDSTWSLLVTVSVCTGTPSRDTVSTSGSGFDASIPFNTRAVKAASPPRTVSPIMPRVTFFLRCTSAVNRTSGPLPPVSFT